jgi:hypothetical protein
MKPIPSLAMRLNQEHVFHLCFARFFFQCFFATLLIESQFAGFVDSTRPPLAAPLPGIAGATAAAAPISVAVSSGLGLIAVKAWAAGAACCAPTISVAAALLLIADVANTAAPAAAAAFPARGPIGVFAASSAHVFPALSSTTLPPTSVTVGAASSTAALTVGALLQRVQRGHAARRQLDAAAAA